MTSPADEPDSLTSPGTEAGRILLDAAVKMIFYTVSNILGFTANVLEMAG